jgi:hypothetical protein
MTDPDRLCLAPWVHTYLSPQTERRMCCASREPAQNFEQYIDTAAGTGVYRPQTLEQHWNSDHMRSVRRRMMRNETLPECAVCNEQLLNTDVYRSYFNQMFGHLRESVLAATDQSGSTTAQPVSWDYRFTNLCNFKCRMCGDMLSSSWESEQRTHNMIDWTNPKNGWMQPAVRAEISKFQDTQIEAEFAQAVREHRVEEVYWVGGEPLMYEQHWRYMKQIVDQGDGDRVYARYNTNLSRVDFKGISLYDDILCHLRDYQICASLDGTGAIGEYIRTGLDYSVWRDNFARGRAQAKHRRQWRIDFTLTLPGLFEVERIQALAREFDVDILAKVVFGFGPDIILSPLALPRELLDKTVDRLTSTLPAGALQDVLVQLKRRPTFSEQWNHGEAAAQLSRGKQRILKLENIRGDSYTLADILHTDPEIGAWYDSIA